MGSVSSPPPALGLSPPLPSPSQDTAFPICPGRQTGTWVTRPHRIQSSQAWGFCLLLLCTPNPSQLPICPPETCPTCSQESGRDPQLVNQSPQAGCLPRCAGSSERHRLKHPWGWGVRPRVRDRRRRPGRATYMRAGAGGTDAKLGAETDRHREEDCRVRQ